MLNRRYIRIKVFQLLYVWHTSKSESSIQINKKLNQSFDGLYSLQLYIISFFKALVFEANERIERDKTKKLPSQEDLNPNYRFVNNRVIQKWENCEQLTNSLDKRKINWASESDFVRKTLDELKKRDQYQRYMSSPRDNFRQDKDFVLFLFKNIVSNSVHIHHLLESLNVHWYDDVNFVNARLLFFLEDLKEDDEESFISELFKDEESDDKFAKELVDFTIKNDEKITSLIKSKTENWETERIALADIILMKMALVELLYFKTIPVKVSMNEYIDISKFYSTPKSKIFINGVLDKLLIELKESGEITKQGRGLIGF